MEVLAHTPLQLVVPGGQPPPPPLHMPPTQLCPAGHGLLQAPQLFVSLEVLTQAPPQLVVPVGQQTPLELNVPAGQAQTPLLQPAPAGQRLPQAPQLFTLLLVLVSQPLAGLLSQLAKPALQVKPHAPLLQIAVALAGVGQRLLQAPQCCGLVRMFVSQPLLAFRSQSANPALQTKPHVPPTQVGVALAGVGHWLPQAPQLPTSVSRLVSQPLATLASQLPNPARQTKLHWPWSQTGVALGRGGQRLPHIPQFLTSVFRLAQRALLQQVSPGLQQKGLTSTPQTGPWPRGAAGPHLEQIPPPCAASLLQAPR